MNISLRSGALVLALILAVLFAPLAMAEEKGKAGSSYTIVEGVVTSVKARSLEINGQAYPVSMFVRVFQHNENGPEMSMQTIANIGRIDKARLYILGGRVEKIIVINNL